MNNSYNNNCKNFKNKMNHKDYKKFKNKKLKMKMSFNKMLLSIFQI